jgi:UDP-N-acetylglucosamine--N-acetylmuramyl-(pentapeptide) pyrophosphoryl-undecaprenol N-acetylglucosamine transferase
MKVAISSGGTGGHFFPAKALSDKLIEENYKVMMLLDNRALAYKSFLSSQVLIRKIASRGLHKTNIIFILKLLVIMFIGFWQSLYFFIIYRPKCLISFGGYSSFNPVLVAFILRIPIVMHEQNAVLGKVNRILSKFATIVALTFENTRYSEQVPNKIITGLPLRKEFYEIECSSKMLSSKAVFVILGGSLGARIFSDIIPKAFDRLSDNDKKIVEVYHQCRQEHISEVLSLWQKTGVKVHIKPFFDNIIDILKLSNFIISRSGASIVAEIESLGKHAIYIPFKGATEDHQYLNALSSSKRSNAEIILEEHFNEDILTSKIIKLLEDYRSFNNTHISQRSNLNGTTNLYNIIFNLTINQHKMKKS